MVSNAVDATAEANSQESEETLEATANGKVTIELEDRDTEFCVFVSDNGCGIAEEDADKIFSPFESSKGSKGTGLGLPVSQKILREHGGEISFKSQKGQGTRFCLRWPKKQGSNEGEGATLRG